MLIITADDLGLSRAVTKGVLEAHRRGVVRSAGLLVTYPASPEAAAEARLERDLEVGLHIDLARSWGTPALAWDSHRHVHLMPPVARVVGGVAKEMGARWVRRGRAYGATLVPKQAALSLATLVSELSLRHVAGNGWFLDVTYVRPRLDAEAVALLAMRGGVGEISSHPGYIDDDLRHADSLVEPREYDLELLTDPLLLEALGRDAVSWRVR
jgi:predicted glycoside hydrolase/deacetylase ChbG (UPF0249 family)